MHKEQLIREALSLPTNAIEYYVSQILADMYSQKALVEGGDGLFDIEEYAGAGHCTIEQKAIIYNQVVTYYQGQEMSLPGMMPGLLRLSGILPMNMGPSATEAERKLIDRAKNAWLEVQWRDSTFDVVVMNWFHMGPVYHYWILADQVETAKAFLQEVCRWNGEVRGEMLVFDSGCWRKDATLFQSIKGATFNNLVMKGHLDPSILDRPSRFDRKYPFDLPELAERLAYISMWNGSLKPSLQLTEEGIARLGGITEGFSFAYLKELFLSSMMRWIAVEQKESIPETMQQAMETQVGALREQMMSASTLEAEVPSEQSLLGMPGFMMGRRFIPR